METVLITGGTGTIGKAITKLLSARGYKIIILSRKPAAPENKNPFAEYAAWNTGTGTIDIAALQKADYILHLAGAGVVDKKWTAAYKMQIQKSRTESSKLIVEALKNNTNKVKTVVSASAIGWYGEDSPANSKAFIETDAPDTGFLGETCRLWEQSIEPVEALQKRLVKLRTGIVLSNDGGALVEFKKPVKLGVAGILGSGKQIVSWIHIDDLCRMYLDAIENKNLSGSYNAVAPNPVTNKMLTIELAKKIKCKFFIPLHVPVFVLKTMLGERSTEVLKSTTVSSVKITQTGFTFLYPTINTALDELCKA
jgi:uncharacterized protein